ncbi:DUF7550 family protein [Salinilacihabitans rarus]|uniref:DUF7550 family protein n=1 Tax=Salinilacihabitans rarus TaxID=2961596 RepID=UPI0020C8DDB3|nr:hypothetical protein [Salinilacihabitans rarus]
MADESESTDEGEGDSAATVGHDRVAERTTAPMSEFGARETAVGALVAVVGVAVAFGIPLVAF